ncbi:hypothetical protein GCM10009630_57770 [Kribbella jejuensis]|uniref:Tachylectin n=1 Tax=Kribbella jejuensis TaxID=236068 RepID=A0A542ENF1_9ACTN|nr:hypothetical protein [Kribbella jejuensis]TQJ16880.1 hypothetical protein FB475_0986 [Kribbella jejuensis]
MIKYGRTLAAATLVTSALVTAPAGAAPATSATTTAACSLRLGSVTPGGDHTSQTITATPSANPRQVGPKDLYPDGQAHLPTAIRTELVVPAGEERTGLVALGSRMYGTSYLTDGTGTAVVPGSVTQTLIGGGWDDLHKYVELSHAAPGGIERTNVYSLINQFTDGLIARWTVTPSGWKYYTTFGGFKSVKTMALIGQGSTYDTFLATTNGGALYTVKVPTGAGKPVVTKIRTSTWQGFETLIAEKCGNYGTLLLGIDKDTGTGYLYAVGHANGTATVIKGLGKVPTTFPAADSYFRFYNTGTVLNGG